MDAVVIIEFLQQKQRQEDMKGYETCDDCEYKTREEGAGKHSEKITKRDEEGEWVKAVLRLAISGDGTGRQTDTTK